MRKVEIYTYKQNDGKLNLVSTGETGWFHQFGVDFEELQGGVGNFSTAIVETPDGSLRSLPVETVRFMVEAE